MTKWEPEDVVALVAICIMGSPMIAVAAWIFLEIFKGCAP